MSTPDTNIQKKAIELIESFFVSLSPEDRAVLPSILRRGEGKWAVLQDQSILAIFYLDEVEQKRISEFQKKGWNPFPAFFAPKDKEGPVAFDMGGTDGFFSSNRISNMYSFKIRPGTSFTVSEHFQDVVAPSGEKIQYKIDLAFLLSLSKNEQWNNIEKRLKDLLESSMRTWREVK